MHVRPERVFVWPEGDVSREPELFDSHLEEVRSGHDEAAPVPHDPPEGGEPAWDDRLNELGERHRTAVLSLVSPDGFPFSFRTPVTVDERRGSVRIELEPVGAPLQPGLACLVAHDHHPTLRWERNFQVRGDLVEDENGWVLVPRRLVGGLEVPPGSKLAQYRLNARKILRFRSRAKAELRRRTAGTA